MTLSMTTEAHLNDAVLLIAEDSYPSTDVPINEPQLQDESYFPTESLSSLFTPFGVENESQSLFLPATRDSLYIVVPITVLYTIIFFTGILGNAVTCIVISRNKHMHTATNYYLFSLAVSDLLLLVSGLPQELHFIWSRYPYLFGEAFCVLRGLAAETSSNASVLTITAFTVERYIAICHPFLSHTMSKLSRAVKIILAIWLVALAFAIPQAIQFGLIGDSPTEVMCVVKRVVMKHSFEVSTFLFFVTPMTLITVLYALIGLRLRRSTMMKSSGSFSQNRGHHHQLYGHEDSASAVASVGCEARGSRHYQSPSSRRMLKMLVAVVVAFFICWAPFHAQRLIAIYGTKERNQPSQPIMLTIYAVMTYTSGILYYVSTTINPILYQIMSLKFREAFKNTIARCCGFRSHKRRPAQRPYSVLLRRAQGLRSSCGGGGGGGVGGRGGGVSSSSGGGSTAGPDSAEFSGNSNREDSFTVNSRAPLKSTSSSDTISRLQTTHKGVFSEVFDSEDIPSSNVKQRQMSVLLSARHGHESNVKSTIVSEGGNQKAHKGLLSPHLSFSGKQFSSHTQRKNSFWKILNCISSSEASLDNKNLTIAYSPAITVNNISVLPSSDTLNIIPETISNNSIKSYVSNSSLQDIDTAALEDELTLYMQELQQREEI